MRTLIIPVLLTAAVGAQQRPEVSNCPPMPPGTPPPAFHPDGKPEANGPRIPSPDQALFAAAMRLEAIDGRGELARRWSALITDSQGDAQRAAAFLVATMPTRDLRKLEPAYVAENIRLALEARREFAWAREVPEALFLNDVLPYAALDEERDPWRADFLARLRPVVAGCRTRSEAIAAVNRSLRDMLKVDYNTARRAPNQSPADSIRQGMASCSGLSILLVDAFRAVGIPARVAGCATWVTIQGNHNWVEVWDGGWRVTEYRPDRNGLDHAWFRERAAYADPLRPETRIYAASWAPTGHPFPLVWDLRQRDVSGVDRTAAYHAWSGGPKTALGKDDTLLGVRVFRGALRESSTVEILQAGRSLAKVVTAHPDQDMADVPWVRVRISDGPVTLRCDGREQVAELRGGGETVVDLRLTP